jgi:hypothetical protein
VLRAEQQLPSYLYNWLRRSPSYDLNDYYRQYVGFTTADGRFLYVHAFVVIPFQPIDDIAPDWRTKHLGVCDGGDISWGAEFNLQTGRFQNLSYNARPYDEPPAWERFMRLVPRAYRRLFADLVMTILFVGTGVICSLSSPQHWVRTTLLCGSLGGVIFVSFLLGAPHMFSIAGPHALALGHFYILMLVVGLVFSGGLLVQLFRILSKKLSDGV